MVKHLGLGEKAYLGGVRGATSEGGGGRAGGKRGAPHHLWSKQDKPSAEADLTVELGLDHPVCKEEIGALEEGEEEALGLPIMGY